jgi:hypothetical protein
MPNANLQGLVEFLSSKEEYLAENKLLNITKVSQLAREYDVELLKFLQSNEEIKKQFFVDVAGGIAIFKLVNFKRYDRDGEHEVKELNKNDNLIIKGNNLVVLHSLEKRFAGMVKLIYIDPPYNTGNDSFGYNDKFNHSYWLTFMKNRGIIDINHHTIPYFLYLKHEKIVYFVIDCHFHSEC